MLRLDLRELRKKGGGFFGSGESTGSIGVVTINLPRLAYKSKTEKEFYEQLDHLMDLAARSLKVKRDVVTRLMEAGLYPYTKRYLGTFNNHFSTIGLVGMNEAGLNASWLKKDLTHPEVQQFAKDVLNHMRERLSDYQVQYGDLYNLEATPAESTTYRFAKHDKVDYPDIITANMSGTPYYTNSSHLPVGYTEDIFSALDIQDELQTLYTSGTVFHAFLGERLPDWRAAMTLVRKIAENYRLPYYTMSPTYSICREHGYLKGEEHTCPYCGKPTEIYSRITGYYRPVQNWNDGKTQEFKDRRTYNIGNSIADESKFLDLPELSGDPLKEFEPFKQILDKERERETRLQQLKDITNAAIAKNTPPELLIDLGYTEKRIPNEFSKFADDAISETLGRSIIESHCGPDGCSFDKSFSGTDEVVQETENLPVLYSTKTCPNCKIAKRYLDDAGVIYDARYVEDHMDEVEMLNITTAPTLVADGKQYTGVSAIRDYIVTLK